MAVSTHTVKASDGTTTKPADKPNSGTVANGGNIAGSILTAQSPMALVKGADRYGSYITTRTGTASIPGINKANTSGRVAFNPNAETRTLANTGFVVRGGVGNNIAGVSGLNPIAVNGYKGAKTSSGVHKKIKYYGYGKWSDTIFDLFAGSRKAADGAVKTDIQNYGTATTYTNAIHASNPATDSAASPSRATPGEFFILSTFTGFGISVAANNDVSGHGTTDGAGPYMDYSAVTGG